jgi:WD40 repeat protein
MARDGKQPKVFSVRREKSGWHLDRRSFLASSAALIAAACDCEDRDVNLVEWDNQQFYKIKAHRWSSYLDFTINSQILISCGDNSFKLWLIPEYAHLTTFKDAYTGQLEHFAFNPLQQATVYYLDRGELFQYSFYDGKKEVFEIEGLERARKVFMVPGTLRMLICTESALVVYDVLGKEVLDTMAFERPEMTEFAMSADGTTLAARVGLSNLPVNIYSLDDFKPIGSIDDNLAFIEAFALSPDGKTLATANRKGDIRRWSIPDCERFGDAMCQRSVNDICFSREGSLMVTAGSKIKLWDYKTGEQLFTIKSVGFVETVRFSPDDTLLASGDSFGHIQIWSIPDGRHLASLMDLDVNDDNVEGSKYTVETADGGTVTYTVPCGTPIPEGAVCTCNCVPGSVSSAGAGRGTGTRSGRGRTTGGGHYWHPN